MAKPHDIGVRSLDPHITNNSLHSILLPMQFTQNTHPWTGE